MEKNYHHAYFREGRDVTLFSVERHHHGAMGIIRKSLTGRTIARALDVGCGTGAFTVALLELAHKVVGIDVSTYALKVAGKRFQHNKRVRFMKVDLEKRILPLKTGSFEAIICLHVLEHIRPDKLTCLIENLHRSLTASGILIVAVPNCGASYRKLFGDKNFGRQDPTHLNYFTPSTLDKLLRPSFVSTHTFTYPVPFIWMHSPIFARVFSFNLGNNIYSVCQKQNSR